MVTPVLAAYEKEPNFLTKFTLCIDPTFDINIQTVQLNKVQSTVVDCTFSIYNLTILLGNTHTAGLC